MTIAEGDALPDLELTMPDGGPVRLGNYAGAPFVLYFYPKDDTTGCTREAQAFSDHIDAFKAAGAAVLGVSKDSPAKHRKFIDKYGLTVPLASDEDGRVVEAFGAWVEKTLYGRKYMGIDRSTFVFDAAGRLVRAWRKVKVPGHVDDVLETVRALG
ncbi:MAG TPA: peroxiredoxin [Sphingomonas sp.]|nr:peroxiredoxin [Sphingomonas sp.]